jgi:hypothetical protein
MSRTARPRRYTAPLWISLLRPLLRYSSGRDAYVLRAVGGSIGPVLRPDRRNRGLGVDFKGVERRGAGATY